MGGVFTCSRVRALEKFSGMITRGLLTSQISLRNSLPKREGDKSGDEIAKMKVFGV